MGSKGEMQAYRRQKIGGGNGGEVGGDGGGGTGWDGMGWDGWMKGGRGAVLAKVIAHQLSGLCTAAGNSVVSHCQSQGQWICPPIHLPYRRLLPHSHLHVETWTTERVAHERERDKQTDRERQKGGRAVMMWSGCKHVQGRITKQI